MTRFMLALVLAASTLASVFGQTQNLVERQADANVTITTAEVLLDAVVRDKKGRIVRDLTIADFEVYEDNTRQDLKSSRFIVRDSAASEASLAAKSVRDSALAKKIADKSTGGASALAFVFDRLKPESRGNVRQAAMSYVGNGVKAAEIAGVFAIDQSLKVVQPFTNDEQLIREAVDRASSMNSSTYYLASELDRGASRGSHAATAFGGQIGLDREGPAQKTSVVAGSAVNATSIADAIMARMTQLSLEVFERLERDQQGFATTDAMLAVIESLNQLPGRKSVIFFSDGLAIPTAVQPQFQSIINAANRANVSIYTVDAAGLRSESATGESRRQINALAARSANRGNSSGEDTSGQPLTRDLESNENLLRLNPHSGLGQLADQTGGFLIRDTNDLESGLQRIDEDMAAYYLLSYTSQNQNYDGRFRQIEVKLKRPGLDVRSRKGYFAINGSFAAPVLGYEAPALAIAIANRRPQDLAVRTTALSFPEARRPGLVPVIVEVPARFVTFATDNQKKSYTTNFSVVVLIRNDQRQVVRKLSNQYVLAGALDKLEAARQGNVLFYREIELKPGEYTVETIVHDALGDKAGTHQAALEVPAAVDDARLRLSSVVIVKRAEQLKSGEQKNVNPFHYGEMLLYPNTGEALHKSMTRQLTFFFTAYTAKAALPPAKFTIEVMKNNQTVGKVIDTLPAPDTQGRIQYASALPLEQFTPGDYQLKITVPDERGAVTSTTAFTVIAQ